MTPEQFERTLKRDLRRLQREADRAVRRTSRKAVRVVVRNIPIAFGELKDSLHAVDLPGPGHIASTIAEAPHAAAVEVGSRPHLVPLDELVKWVKLRGMQGLSKAGRVRSSRWKATGMGVTTADHARRVARQLKGMRVNGATPIDAPEQIARAIQQAILHSGTKPHWYMAKSLPEIEAVLDAELHKVFK